ncbi:MAG: TetR family transcriptional regulator [Micrococcus sp.]|nr:TetR family transcriptional regulator [Micrococcus sp.]
MSTRDAAATRPRRALSAADVVDAALTLLQDFGMGDLSMRRVATQLGVQVSALYWHVPNKQTLLARVADRIVDGLATDAAAPASLAEAEERTQAALLSYRDGADVVLTALALGLGGGALHTVFIAAAQAEGATAAQAEAALARVLGATAMRQHRSQAQALGVEVGPDYLVHLHPATTRPAS